MVQRALSLELDESKNWRQGDNQETDSIRPPCFTKLTYITEQINKIPEMILSNINYIKLEYFDNCVMTWVTGDAIMITVTVTHNNHSIYLILKFFPLYSADYYFYRGISAYGPHLSNYDPLQLWRCRSAVIQKIEITRPRPIMQRHHLDIRPCHSHSH